MKITIELEEPYVWTLKFWAFRNGHSLENEIEESARSIVESEMSADQIAALHEQLAFPESVEA